MRESSQKTQGQERDLLEYFGSLRPLLSNLDVTISTDRYSGVVNVRNGQIVSATQGALSGNGALFTLVTRKKGAIKTQKSIIPVSHDISINYEQLCQVVNKLPVTAGGISEREEGELLDEAVHLFLQFRRKEAGAKLTGILRSNRFYYPAWLWHSRLVNRVDLLGKALLEMKKWGGHFPAVRKEIKKIEPHLAGKKGALKRCIFCYAIVESNQKECTNCHCKLSITATPGKWTKDHGDLVDSLCRYEEEFELHPENSRIAYCLCLGKFSLGDIVQAKSYLKKALDIAPDEQLFRKTFKVLENAAPNRVPVGPVAQDTAVKVQPASSAPKSPVQALPQKKGQRSILVIEDSDTSRKVISLVLSRSGYRIVEATTGKEGLQRLASSEMDLVLLDVMLPDMDGYQVLSEIRNNSETAEVPVVMLTGRRDGSDKVKGLAAGANEYLTKPFDPAKLLGVLGQYAKPQKAVAPAVQPPSPVAPAAEQSPVARNIPAALHNTAPAGKMQDEPVKPAGGATILVVEDSPTTRKVVTMVLQRKGFTCHEAPSGQQALELMEKESYDLVMLDAMLPDMTGYDILLQLKKRGRLETLPVVMLTAKTGATDRQRGLHAGAVAYLTKPFSPDKLLATVKQHLPQSALAAFNK